MYHSVGGGGLSPDIVVTKTHFEEQIRYLTKCYHVVSLGEAVGLVEEGRPLPADSVVVTIDDGYRDNHQTVLPLLKRHGAAATAFVTVDSVESGRPPWSQTLWHYLWTTSIPEARFSWRGRDGALTERLLRLGTEAGRQEARAWLKALAGGLGAEEQQRLLDGLARTLACPAAPKGSGTRAMLSWDEVRDMHRAGVTIGSHTMTHPRLRGLDRDAVRLEVSESRKVLERQISDQVQFFAYPFGDRQDFDDETRCAVRSAGYRAACAAVPGEQHAPPDLMTLGRVYVPDEPAWMLALRLIQLDAGSGLINWILEGSRYR
jgi:peptidoglycan/xylan/chitin deacetylase (PgdA/CDA1 family)